jgi:hypothetical protein
MNFFKQKLLGPEVVAANCRATLAVGRATAPVQFKGASLSTEPTMKHITELRCSKASDPAIGMPLVKRVAMLITLEHSSVFQRSTQANRLLPSRQGVHFGEPVHY